MRNVSRDPPPRNPARASLSPDERAAVRAVIERCGVRVAAGVLGVGPRTVRAILAGEPVTAALAAYAREGLARVPR